MPHVQRSMLIPLDAAADDLARVLHETLGLEPDTGAADDQSDAGMVWSGPIVGMPDTESRLLVHFTPDAATGRVRELTLIARSDVVVPFFTWFLRLQGFFGARRALPHAAARLRAGLAGEAAPPPLSPWALVPPVPFTPEQAGRLGALALVALLANFAGSLLSQNGDAVTSAFGRSDQALGAALAIARAGVLLSLVAIALADRLGRRRLILVALVGACGANALAAVSPTFEVFTASQVVTRALVNTALIVAAIAAVEEAPDGARAFATGMYALALGAGFALSVVLLPLADLGDFGWRISFALGAALVLLVPMVARHLRETTRYEQIAKRSDERGRVREVFDRAYRLRFLLLGLAAFLTNVFSAPSSQLMNRYLTHAHHFSNSDVAIFRTVTAGVPGLVGVLLASRLAESRGRRPVTIVGLLVATAAQGAFFLTSGNGALLWITPVISIIAAACAGLALGTLDAELFPTEVRGTSNGFLLVSGVAGSAVGLVLATQLKDVMGGLGPAIAVCGIATLLAALFVVPRLPETADRRLDEVSPSEV
jgi:predicted MFS family arabinose efflux permease